MLIEEQLKIIKKIKKNNMIINAVAGSGKTTTSLYIAKTYPEMNILLLTYTARLKIETRRRVIEMNLDNIEIHSFHSFNLKYYNKGITDDDIEKTINNNITSKYLINYDLIIIDEVQDMTYLYYKLVKKIYKDNEDKAKILLLGDIYQNIYSFNGSDYRYLTLGKKIFNWNNYKWKKGKLSTSFRLSLPITNFINQSLLKTNLIKNIKNGEKIDYYIGDSFRDITLPLINLLKIYNPNDIFILAPSLKSINSPARTLENQLKKYNKNLPIYVPIDDDEKIDNDIIKDKMLFSSFNQVKGMERKCVIVFNFDDSYFKYYNKKANQYQCPNEIYVALTRSIEKLVLVHHYQDNFLPFLDKTILLFCTFAKKD